MKAPLTIEEKYRLLRKEHAALIERFNTRGDILEELIEMFTALNLYRQDKTKPGFLFKAHSYEGKIRKMLKAEIE